MKMPKSLLALFLALGLAQSQAMAEAEAPAAPAAAPTQTEAPAAAAPFVLDQDYYEVVVEQTVTDPARVSVAEFFWYACPHCYSLEPHLQSWLKNKPDYVDFELIPATFNRPNVLLHARTFYALQAMGLLDDLHGKLFHAIHDEKRRLQTQGEIEAFLKDNEVDTQTFNKMLSSFGVSINLNKAGELAKDFEIRGVPTIVVGGKYRTEAMEAPRMMQLVDFLIEKVRKEQQPES